MRILFLCLLTLADTHGQGGYRAVPNSGSAGPPQVRLPTPRATLQPWPGSGNGSAPTRCPPTPRSRWDKSVFERGRRWFRPPGTGGLVWAEGGGGSWCRCDPRSRPWPGCLYSGSGPPGPPLSVTGGVVMEPGRVLLLPPRGCVCSPGSSPVGCPGRGSRFCVCPLCHRVSPPTPHLGPGPPQPGRTGVPRPGAAGAGEVVVRLEKSGYGVGSSGGMWEVVGVGKPGQVGELGGGRVSRVPQQWGPSSGHPRCWGEPGL